jgi:uncharacterized protein YecE (DUF72 family)
MTNEKTAPSIPLHIGCPVWNSEGWSDVVYPQGTKRPQWLSWYTRMFNCVEGNSSFYAIPTVENARRWGAESAVGFKFCMKFPREISHDRGLVRVDSVTREFLLSLDELARADRLGPTFLQLGPHFGADRFDVLSNYLKSLPADFRWAVEVRHLSWYDGGVNERRLDDLLTELAMDKVIFDSRPLYQSSPEDESERLAQSRKPKTPLRQTATGSNPMLRLIGRNRVELVDEFIDEWVPTIVDWIDQGHVPYVFTHTPDDTYAPHMARRFWERLRAALPGDYESLPLPPRKPRQLDLL